MDLRHEKIVNRTGCNKNNKADVAGTHDHEGQSAETGDRLGRVFDLKIRIGRAKTNARGNNPGNEEKNVDIIL